VKYTAYISQEGKFWLAEFPDCPGCQTFTQSGNALPAAAKEALEGWLEAHLEHGKIPPKPGVHARAPRGHKLSTVHVDPGLAMSIQIRQARAAARLTQAQLAQRADVSQQQIAKLERPGANPTIDTIEKIARALGMRVEADLIAADLRPASRCA
jgi:predicted RNase H-like HicB family nuclease/DNA-binding XRE family transcriptional regulator